MNEKTAGYSLLEVLIAFAVMMMVLAVLLPGQAHLMSRTTDIDERIIAQDYAFSRMDQIGVLQSIETGQTQTSYRNWIVRQSIEETETNEETIQILKVTITVEAKSGKPLALIEALKAVP